MPLNTKQLTLVVKYINKLLNTLTLNIKQLLIREI